VRLLAVLRRGSARHRLLSAAPTFAPRVELRRAGDRQPISRTISEFDLLARGDAQAKRREASMTGLSAGEYVLELTLVGPGGRTTRTRPLRLR
jgi:hypothetical protein